MKLNFNVDQLREDYVRAVTAKFGEESAEIKTAQNMEDIDLVKKAKNDGFDVMVYIDSVEYDTGEKMSAYEARCAAEQFFSRL